MGVGALDGAGHVGALDEDFLFAEFWRKEVVLVNVPSSGILPFQEALTHALGGKHSLTHVKIFNIDVFIGGSCPMPSHLKSKEQF